MTTMTGPTTLSRAEVRRRQEAGNQILDEDTLSTVRTALSNGDLGMGNLTPAGESDGAAISAALSASGRVLGSDALRELTLAARAELTGAGPLQYWLDLDGVTDVLVNAPGEVWVERHSQLSRVALDLGSENSLRALAVRLAALAGQRLDDASPICDGSLPDGTRFHGVLAPLCRSGAVISLRVLRQDHFTLEELRSRHMFPPEWFGLLRNLVQRRANVLISGGTGCGKTTLLAALLGGISESERLVTVEEARELNPPVAHHIPLMARRSNVEGAGEVNLADLVRAALRMRPDRLVLGECRGAEVREVLGAMNTGHSGALATLHANSVAGVPARLEALAALAGMTREATAAQTLGAVDVVLQLKRHQGQRLVCGIGVPVATETGLGMETVARWSGTGEPVVEPGPWAEFTRRWLT